eukprot:15435808-Alexandrium_andersonii.AAC.1
MAEVGRCQMEGIAALAHGARSGSAFPPPVLFSWTPCRSPVRGAWRCPLPRLSLRRRPPLCSRRKYILVEVSTSTSQVPRSLWRPVEQRVLASPPA